MTSRSAGQLLLVDDDVDITALLARYFEGHGFAVRIAANGAQLRSMMGDAAPALVLLDLGLPDEDGLTLLSLIHRHWQCPVIVVSGRGEAVERVVGLELGADDYVSKPFDLRELLARVRSVLRRADATPNQVPVTPKACHFDGFVLTPTARTLTDSDGADVPLTSGEFDLLRALVDRPNEVLTRDQLMTDTHGRRAGPFDRAIDVQVGRLRRKIEADPSSPRLIRSVRGVGYLFAGTVVRH